MRGSTYFDAPRQGEQSQGSLAATIIAVTAAFRSRFATWRNRTRYRRALAQMSERELGDIGVTWSQVAEEINKPFWHA
jgi:uncharacterized protein YjiS (DUF1127 family)